MHTDQSHQPTLLERFGDVGPLVPEEQAAYSMRDFVPNGGTERPLELTPERIIRKQIGAARETRRLGFFATLREGGYPESMDQPLFESGTERPAILDRARRGAMPNILTIVRATLPNQVRTTLTDSIGLPFPAYEPIVDPDATQVIDMSVSHTWQPRPVTDLRSAFVSARLVRSSSSAAAPTRLLPRVDSPIVNRTEAANTSPKGNNETNVPHQTRPQRMRALARRALGVVTRR